VVEGKLTDFGTALTIDGHTIKTMTAIEKLSDQAAHLGYFEGTGLDSDRPRFTCRTGSGVN
jgi:hypothetical protein